MHLVFFRLYVGGSHEGGNEGGNTGTKEEAKKGRKGRNSTKTMAYCCDYRHFELLGAD